MSDVDEGLEKVLKEPFVFVQALMSIEMAIIRRGRGLYHLGKDRFYPQGYGVVCTKGSPFRSILDKTLARMTEAGLIHKWARDELNKLSVQVSKTRRVASDGGAGTGEGIRGPTALTLAHLSAGFLLLAIGYGLAFVALTLEKGRHWSIGD
ncbi:uncharacterized protein LOC143027941 [Oratosquilla oratoria]|uniref:uncharacterized protein LOC143027941 n=1 Tax=Oratosquilla oratoria TaxID=337810 RepID=UPI003F76F5E5